MTKNTIYINKVYALAKGLLSLGILPLMALLTACDHIADNEQLIEVKRDVPPVDPTSTSRTVLLEDFTGQRCVNCPLGTAVIDQLHQAFGDQVIAVGIHSGPLGFKGNAKTVGLATDLGDEYYDYWKLEYQPVGLINRGAATNYTDWITAVRQELGYVSEIMMTLTAQRSDGQIAIHVSAKNLGGDYSGKLQLWVLEDGITALQMMPDGSSNRDYVHNHVLRTAVNGTWGTELTLANGQTASQTFTQPMDAQWNGDNLSVVAFVYNSDGVEQAIQARVE